MLSILLEKTVTAYIVKLAGIGVGVILQEVARYRRVLNRLALGFRPASHGDGREQKGL